MGHRIAGMAHPLLKNIEAGVKAYSA